MADSDYGKEPRLPAIPDIRTASAEAVLHPLKEWVEVRQGLRGDPLDRGVTMRDLLNAGIATPGAINGLIDGPPPFPLEPGGTDPDIPPTPTALAASGAISTIILTWQFAAGYSRLAYFEVWRSATDAVGSAVKIAQVFSPIYSDPVGPGATFYYWVRAVSDAGKSPFNAVAGTKGQTALDPGYILDLLEGKITETEQYTTLGQRINLIDGPISLPGSVNQRVNTVAVQTAENSAAIQTEATVRSYADGQINAKYTVKIDVNGHVSGFGLISEANNAAPYSSFIVRADSFAIGAPSVGAPTLPFIVRTTPTTINGVAVPVGTYIRDAYIANGVISNAKIGNLAVDDAKVSNMSVAKLIAGKLGIGEYIESTLYAGGSAGFRIHGNGNAEFNNVTVRGTVYASAGSLGGNAINASGIQSPGYTASTGWRIDSNGTATFNTGVFRGSITGATGTFAGNLHGGQFTTGNFTGYAWPAAGGVGSYLGPSGLLLGNANDGKYFQVSAAGDISAPGFSVVGGVMTISQANVINTLNVAGQAVTGIVAADGGSGDMAAGGSLPMCAAAINMPSGASGVVLSLSVTLVSASGSSNALHVYRNGVLLRTWGVSVQGGYVTTVAVTGSDPSPLTGVATYQMVLSNNTSGPGSNVPVTYMQPTIVVAGSKR